MFGISYVTLSGLLSDGLFVTQDVALCCYVMPFQGVNLKYNLNND